jgi:hypothetical protein
MDDIRLPWSLKISIVDRRRTRAKSSSLRYFSIVKLCGIVRLVIWLWKVTKTDFLAKKKDGE